MTRDLAGWDIADAIADPESVFSHPDEVLAMEQLSRHDMLAILESWRELEQVENNAGFPREPRSPNYRLSDIEKAIGLVK